MSTVKDRVGEAFDESLPRLLEFLEGVVGQHPQWSFIRKVTLKQVNNTEKISVIKKAIAFKNFSSLGHRKYLFISNLMK